MDFMGSTLLPFIGKQISHHQSLNESMNRLKRKCEELNCRKEDVESKMKTELKPGKKFKKEVELWLATVQRINDEKQSIEHEATKGRYLGRPRLGKLIAEKIQEVEELHQKGSFSDGLVVDALPPKGAILPTTKLAGETTAQRKMEEIWACLINDDVRKVGVYGMGGCGKTTIMKHINNHILEETDEFESVIWVTMSKALNVKRLRNDIASAFNVDISEPKDEAVKAAKLYSFLIKKKRYILILDDLWKAFRLEDVGIPEPSLDNGCKIVLTTRSLDVCRRMNCKAIKMELLSKEEAWNLFFDNIGQGVFLTPSLEATMKLVTKECARLPLAIITIAGSMKGVVDECEWRNALEELRESTKELNEMRKVFGQLKYSYNRLEDETLRRCLLYCALYPEDHMIERRELIEHLIVEGIIKGMRSRQAEFDKGHSLLNKLENACLLESCTNYVKQKYVKMHDLIRDMALQIMSPRSMVEAGVQLTNLPDDEKWTEDLERVSLMYNVISEIHSKASPRCSRLSTLLLSTNHCLTQIPDSFFVFMCGLRVLDLSDTTIRILPNSISNLDNLTALLLGHCWCLKYVPSLAKLKVLRMLDLSHTAIEEVPRGMEMLVNLRFLDLNAQDLKILPTGILPKLSHLQCLNFDCRSKTLKLKGEEVVGLRKLENFAVQFYDLHDFNVYVRSLQGQGPRKYFLQVGSGNPHISVSEEWADYIYSKCVILKECYIGRGVEDPLVLPNDIGSFEIKKCHDVSSLCDVSSLNDATDFLESCKIIECSGIECVLSSSSSYNTRLQSLEVLLLSKLWNLRALYKRETSTFPCLRILTIHKCPNIKKLFMPGLLPHLQNLEVIYVSDCEKLEEIISAKVDGEEEQEQGMGESNNDSVVNNDDTIVTITLPKLRNFHLEDVPELKSIVCSTGIMVCDSLQLLLVHGCPKLKRLPLSLPMLNGEPSPPPTLEHIYVDDREWWESLKWDHPTAKDVLKPFLPPWVRQPVR